MTGQGKHREWSSSLSPNGLLPYSGPLLHVASRLSSQHKATLGKAAGSTSGPSYANFELLILLDAACHTFSLAWFSSAFAEVTSTTGVMLCRMNGKFVVKWCKPRIWMKFTVKTTKRVSVRIIHLNYNNRTRVLLNKRQDFKGLRRNDGHTHTHSHSYSWLKSFTNAKFLLKKL